MNISNYYVEGTNTNPSFINGEYTINGVTGERNMICFYLPYYLKGSRIKVSFDGYLVSGEHGEVVLTGNEGSYLDTININNTEITPYSFEFPTPYVDYTDIRIEFGFKTSNQGVLKIRNLKISYVDDICPNIVLSGLIRNTGNDQIELHPSFPTCGIRKAELIDGDIKITFLRSYKNNIRPLISVSQNFECQINGVLRVGSTTNNTCTIRGYDVTTNTKIPLNGKVLYFVVQGII